MSFDDERCRTVAESADRLVWAQVFMSGRGGATVKLWAERLARLEAEYFDS